MLVSLHLQLSLSKPGGVMLFSPWLSLHHTPSTNAEADVLSASSESYSTTLPRHGSRRYAGNNDGSAARVSQSMPGDGMGRGALVMGMGIGGDE